MIKPVALITGASGGIGTALVSVFAERGWTVVAVDRDPVKDADLLHSRSQYDVVELIADLSRDAEITELSERVAAEHYVVDALVNNAAAVPPRSAFAAQDAGQVHAILDINVLGPLRLVQALRPLLGRSAGASVVNVSSIGASRAFRRNLGYCASKGAVESLTRALALDLAPDGIRVNAVAPGMVRTSVWDGVAAEEVRRREELVPLARPADPREVATTVHFLASPDAAYVTGVVLPVDGGLSVQAYPAEAEPGLAAVPDFPAAFRATS